MKKTISIVFIMIIILMTSAYPQGRVVVKEGIVITVDRTKVRTDVPPISVNGRTLVPVRSVFDAFDAEVQWFPREGKVYVRDGTTIIWLRIGENHAQINDDIVPMEVPAMIYRGRTMVPLRFIAETLGASVNWNPETQIITITTRYEAPVR